MIKSVKICILRTGSKHHPAADNLTEILNDVLSKENVLTLDYQSFIANVPKFIKFAIYIFDQLAIAIKLLKVLPRIDGVLIFQKNHFFPILLTDLTRKKTILYVGGLPTADSFYKWRVFPSLTNKLLYVLNLLLTNLCNAVAHVIVTITPSMVKSAGLERYKEKVYFAPIFPNPSTAYLFNIKKPYADRQNIIGFVGSFEEIKGIMNFVDAIPYILERLDDIQIVIIGGGKLSETIRLKLEKYCTKKVVKIYGWMAYSMLPDYYNNFKLLILPSYNEGVPSVLLEAMSCGTPSLATPVGGIPDIIKDCETGFILEQNDPKYIASKIVELFNKPRLLEKVSNNAYRWVKENFNEERLIKTWEEVFEQLLAQD